jgi:CO dehydrogenase maturation factor
LLLDELARSGYHQPVLAVDADPAMTLHLALGLLEPVATVATVRDTTPLDGRTVRNLPAGSTVSGYVRDQLQAAGVVTRHRLREMPLDLLAMGQNEGPGCYCNINLALASVLNHIVAGYSLVVIDNEAGLEHISRYRLPQADLLAVVTRPNPAAQAVARRILETVQQVEMEIGLTWLIFNAVPDDLKPVDEATWTCPLTMVPDSRALVGLETRGEPAVKLAPDDPARRALSELVEQIRRCA